MMRHLDEGHGKCGAYNASYTYNTKTEYSEYFKDSYVNLKKKRIWAWMSSGVIVR
jgi:hypothetical protein